MRRKMWGGSGLFCLVLLMGFIQNTQAQKETFFHHFNQTRSYLSAAGTGAQGLAINSLYRNFNDSLSYYFSVEVPVNSLNSAIGAYTLHNTSGATQNIRSGLSYTGFIRFGRNTSLRLGMQGNRHQKALSSNTWAFREYRSDTVYYSADASLFLQRGKLSLGLAVHQLLPAPKQDLQTYLVLLSFNELRTNSWLRSSPSMLMQIKPGQYFPDWRFNYTATIANTLVLGASYYKNSDYLYGLNAGFKLFNTIWLTAATDFVDTRLPYRAIYEFGLRINLQKKEVITEKQDNGQEEEEEWTYSESIQ